MEIVKNCCFGGFGLSPEGAKRYLERKGKKAFFYKQTKYRHRDGEVEYTRVEMPENNSLFYSTVTKDLGEKTNELPSGEDYFLDLEIERTDKDLIAVIKEMGSGYRTGASSCCADLQIVEIPDGTEFEIHEYDGLETIREKHNSW